MHNLEAVGVKAEELRLVLVIKHDEDMVKRLRYHRYNE